eukprot:CAMPEP_0195019842 /NCGR_PEP_ID=MMETSP0326_2-20130528/33796_1 /TAXON_ID=2866 ORGANISM="Crypthecodinium cohnii, Strain Seligo" /NCGR_SAMPLE_ID=MMETSP0326_2 /ASSEMBLY_ACC=CAM_ASM_000348 /LENGTH=55 /DNA_ID=CAMNT_0040038135 /DNA_START=201 /DNA_END=366 /DNA_ORIENTATION=-
MNPAILEVGPALAVLEKAAPAPERRGPGEAQGVEDVDVDDGGDEDDDDDDEEEEE